MCLCHFHFHFIRPYRAAQPGGVPLSHVVPIHRREERITRKAVYMRGYTGTPVCDASKAVARGGLARVARTHEYGCTSSSKGHDRQSPSPPAQTTSVGASLAAASHPLASNRNISSVRTSQGVSAARRSTIPTSTKQQPRMPRRRPRKLRGRSVGLDGPEFMASPELNFL